MSVTAVEDNSRDGERGNPHPVVGVPDDEDSERNRNLVQDRRSRKRVLEETHQTGGLESRLSKVEKRLAANTVVLEGYHLNNRETIYSGFNRFMKEILKLSEEDVPRCAVLSVEWAGNKAHPRFKASLSECYRNVILGAAKSTLPEINKERAREKKPVLVLYPEATPAEQALKRRGRYLLSEYRKGETASVTPMKVGASGDLCIGKQWQTQSEFSKTYNIPLPPISDFMQVHVSGSKNVAPSVKRRFIGAGAVSTDTHVECSNSGS